MSPTSPSVLKIAVEFSPAGVIVCDEAGTILFVNHNVEAVFGYPGCELIGRAIEVLLPEGLRTTYAADPKPSPHAPDTAEADAGLGLLGLRRDGSSIPIEVGVSMVVGEGGRRCVVLSIVDLSERVEMQQQLLRSTAESLAFERLISHLTARFVSVPADQIGETIVTSLREIAEHLELDRSTWWERTSMDGDDLRAVHTWTRDEYRVVQAGETAARLLPWTVPRLLRGEVNSFETLDDVLDDVDRETYRRFGIKSGVGIPFLKDDQVAAVLGLSATRGSRAWSPELVERLQLVSAVIGQATVRLDSEERLHRALVEIRDLRDHLAAENVVLRHEVTALAQDRTIAAESPAIKEVLRHVSAVGPTTATVLLLGETGVGKAVFAKAIHAASDRHARPMITVNCGAIPSTLIESELFGREKGAYTGAVARQMGRFELAHGATIFLDEIGELPLEAQAKLLRVLQDKIIERLGGTTPIHVDVRIIAATNRDLERAVEERTFREDLYYRLAVYPISIPPLRDRIEDIPALAWAFIEEYSQAFRKPIESLSKDSLAALERYSWPGNVRELRNVIERAMIIAKGPRLVVPVPPGTLAAPPASAPTRLADLESAEIRRVLERVGWRVRGRGGAAEILGLKPSTLDSRMAKLGITRPSPWPGKD